MKTFLKALFPLLVLLLGGVVMYVMVGGVVINVKVIGRGQAQPREVVESDPLVRVRVVSPQRVELKVRSQGTVEPGTDISLVSEVAGTVVSVSRALAAGGYFEQGDLLMAIDPVDYELAVVQANARLLETKARLTREEAEAEIARIEWKELGKDGTASPLLLREPQLAEANAAVESAAANVRLARRDLEKTKIKAPFAGRVLSTSADIGQYVPRGTQLAQVYSIETAEIRLPLSVRELAYVNLPFNFRGENGATNQPTVKLSASLGGKERTWTGKIIRTEGEIDPRTRMITAVAEVENPYGRMSGEDSSPLAAGLFVQAEIEGTTFDNVFELPRTVVDGIGQVMIVDADNRLEFRPVKVLRADRSRVVIQSGLNAGDRVCLTVLEAPVKNMKVRVADEVVKGADGIVQGGGL